MVICNRPELTATERLLEEAGVFQMESEEIGEVVHAVGKRCPVVGARRVKTRAVKGRDRG